MSESYADSRTIELPTEIIERVRGRLPQTDWEDSEAYITHVLEEVLFVVENEAESDRFDPVDEQAAEERLKSLGYLDE